MRRPEFGFFHLVGFSCALTDGTVASASCNIFFYHKYNHNICTSYRTHKPKQTHTTTQQRHTKTRKKNKTHRQEGTPSWHLPAPRATRARRGKCAHRTRTVPIPRAPPPGLRSTLRRRSCRKKKQKKGAKRRRKKGEKGEKNVWNTHVRPRQKATEGKTTRKKNVE